MTVSNKMEFLARRGAGILIIAQEGVSCFSVNIILFLIIDTRLILFFHSAFIYKKRVRKIMNTDQTKTLATETDDTILDMKLFKVMGLYQFLCPAECGGFGQRMHRACLMLVWLNTIYKVVQLAWLPSMIHDFQRTMLFIVTLAYCFMCFIKLYAVSHHRTRLWTILLDSSQFAFTACGARHPDIVRQSRDATSWFLRWFVSLGSTVNLMWLLFPLLRTDHVTVTNADGTVSVYRSTVLSVWFPLPERVHNSMPGWTMLYVAEVFTYSVSMLGYQFFDFYLITLFSVMDAQFRTLCAGYKTLGHRLRKSTSHRHPGSYS